LVYVNVFSSPFTVRVWFSATLHEFIWTSHLPSAPTVVGYDIVCVPPNVTTTLSPGFVPNPAMKGRTSYDSRDSKIMLSLYSRFWEIVPTAVA
jgi:hypothetical protein